MGIERYPHTARHSRHPWRVTRHAGCKDIGAAKNGRHRQARYAHIATTSGGTTDNDGAREDMANGALMAWAPALWRLVVELADFTCSDGVGEADCGRCECCRARTLLAVIERDAKVPASHLEGGEQP